MELLDIYDENRMKTGKTIVRGKERPDEGEYRLVVHICVFGAEGKMLIQQRQPFKSGWSGMWDVSVGGGVTSGDTSRSAAVREIGEELGLTVRPEKLRRVTTVYDTGIIDDYYISEETFALSEIKLQYEEVARVKWADKEEILGMIERKEFIPYHPSLIDLLFYLRENIGTRTYSDNTKPTGQ